ncbi:MAG: replicative DNA helicase [Oscillospiraceae bacterium]|nr:replicative DNA helicase [Oscillospiraceae bacterium]
MDVLDVSLNGTGLTLPYSIETEKALLGAVLIDQGVMTDVYDIVRAEYFYSKRNQGIWREMQLMYVDSSPIDLITVNNAALSAGIFADENESKIYLGEMADTVPSLSNAVEYAKIIREKYLARSLMLTATDILKETGNARDMDVVLDSAEQRIYDLRQGKETQGLDNISMIAMRSFDHLRKITGAEKEKYLGVPTGFRFIDSKLGNMGKGDLVILAARPGMGKTSFAINVAMNVAGISKIPVAIFSIEMGSEQLYERMMSSYASIDSTKLRVGDLDRDDWANIANAMDVLSSMPISIDQSGQINVSDMKAKVRRKNQELRDRKVGLIIVDYIGLMHSERRIDNRVQEVSEITRGLKLMAKELEVPVLALSQLSRNAERPGRDGRPQLSDLRDSGSIEQDADAVLFLYRDAYYNKNEDADQTSAECIIAKNRHGETATVPLSWDGAHTRFIDVDLVRNYDG